MVLNSQPPFFFSLTLGHGVELAGLSRAQTKHRGEDWDQTHPLIARRQQQELQKRLRA